MPVANAATRRYLRCMHVTFALFADAANLSQEGKLNILGVFDALQVGSLPAVHPRATLVLRFKAGAPDGAQAPRGGRPGASGKLVS